VILFWSEGPKGDLNIMAKTDMAGQAAVPTEKAPDTGLALGPRRISKVLPPGYSWLSVPIQTQTLDNLHIQARLSGLGFRQYVERWCQEAFPFNPPASNAPESAPSLTNGTKP
jgi:hypothetical protein